MHAIMFVLILNQVCNTDSPWIITTQPTKARSFEGINEALLIDNGFYMYSPYVSFKKAAMFYNEKDLREWLKQNDANGAILIDVKKGKQYIIKQKKIMRKVEREEFDHYEWKQEEFGEEQ